MLPIGIVLMAFAILAFREIGTYFNRADSPPWTKRGWIGETTVVLFVFLIGLGTLSVISSLVDAAEHGFRMIDVGLAVLALIGALLLARWRRRGRESAPALPVQPRVMDVAAKDTVLGEQPLPPQDQPPAGGVMRRAA